MFEPQKLKENSRFKYQTTYKEMEPMEALNVNPDRKMHVDHLSKLNLKVFVKKALKFSAGT
jgi:hypothetical protein